MLTLASYLYGSHAYFFRSGDASSSVVATATRSRTSGVATIITAASHGLWVGATVAVAGMTDATFNNAAAVVLSVPTGTSFTYANAGGDVVSGADTGGTVTLAGTASLTFRPGPADANWIPLGSVEESSDAMGGEKIELWKPTPGRLRRKDILVTKDALTLKFTCNEWGPFSTEVLYRSLALTSSSTQFNPMEGIAKKGWLKAQRYDHEDNLRLVIDAFCLLTIDGEVDFGGSAIVKPQFMAEVIHSTLNTALL